MTKRAFMACGIVAAIAIASLTTAQVSGQGGAASRLMITAYNGTTPAKPYVSPKTP